VAAWAIRVLSKVFSGGGAVHATILVTIIMGFVAGWQVGRGISWDAILVG
jgi:hypothetical protein